MLADGTTVESRESLFSTVKVSRSQSRSMRDRTSALWGPIAGALRPTAPEHP